MNSDADYSYSEQPVYTSSSSGPSLQLPFAILACTAAIFMFVQVQGANRQKKALRESKTQLTEAFTKREPLVKQSVELKNKLNAMVMDLLILAKNDEDAKAIIARNGIQQNLQGSPSSEAPAPAPAP
jgi:hypothetical protein